MITFDIVCLLGKWCCNPTVVFVIASSGNGLEYVEYQASAN